MALDSVIPLTGTCYNVGVMHPTSEPTFDLEATFKQILEQPDVVIPSEEIEDGELNEDQRATLQKVLEAELPTPEEIQQRAEIAAHNAEVQRKREERLARRAERRANKAPKSTRKRRRRR